MDKTPKDAPYAKLRFNWKRAVNESPDLPRGSKHLATVLCDKYVNKDTGRFWPKNKTLAGQLDLSERTIQRHLRPLENQGFVERVKQPSTRRAYRITFPAIDGDSYDDKLSPKRATELTPEHDAPVTPYKNKGKEQKKKDGRARRSLSVVTIATNEQMALAEWRGWIEMHIACNITELFDLLRSGQSVFLPRKFPQADEADQYREFFDAVLASKGTCLPGR